MATTTTTVNGPELIFFGIVVMFVAIACVRVVFVRRRARTVREQTAAEFGDMCSPARATSVRSGISNPDVLTSRFVTFFTVKRDHRIENAVHEPIAGRDVAVFDCSYLRDDKDPRREIVTCARTAWPAPGAHLRAVARSGVEVHDFHLTTVHFESIEFDEAYMVQCDSRTFAYEVFSQRLIALFLAEPTICWFEIVDGEMLLVTMPCDPEAIAGIVNRIVSTLPVAS